MTTSAELDGAARALDDRDEHVVNGRNHNVSDRWTLAELDELAPQDLL